MSCSPLDQADIVIVGDTGILMARASGMGKALVHHGVIGHALDGSASVRARVTIARNGATR